MLHKLKAHSDDEFSPKLEAYVVKTVIYRSAAANQMMRQLDEHMRLSREINGKRVQARSRVQSRTPKMSAFNKPPKGLPIDFYDVDWFNNTLSLSQKKQMANIHKVMFLPNAKLSLLARPHPDEKLNDKKFTAKHWAEATKKYCMDQLINREEEEETDSDQDAHDDSHSGESIDLSDTDGEDNTEEDGQEEEEEDGDYEEEEEEEDEEDEDEDDIGDGFEEERGGSGAFYVADEPMDEEAEDENRALRFDAWADA